MNDRNHETIPQPALTLMRVLRVDGLTVHRLQYQSADLQDLHRLVGDRSVQVRVDPTDVRKVSVWTEAKWIAASLKFNETAMKSVGAEHLHSLQEYLIEVSAFLKDARR
jgi:Mu transposase, C-terminal